MVIVPLIISVITKKICYNYTWAKLVEVKSTLTNKILDKLLFEKIKRSGTNEKKTNCNNVIKFMVGNIHKAFPNTTFL